MLGRWVEGREGIDAEQGLDFFVGVDNAAMLGFSCR